MEHQSITHLWYNRSDEMVDALHHFIHS